MKSIASIVGALSLPMVSAGAVIVGALSLSMPAVSYAQTPPHCTVKGQTNCIDCDRHGQNCILVQNPTPPPPHCTATQKVNCVDCNRQGQNCRFISF